MREECSFSNWACTPPSTTNIRALPSPSTDFFVVTTTSKSTHSRVSPSYSKCTRGSTPRATCFGDILYFPSEDCCASAIPSAICVSAPATKSFNSIDIPPSKTTAAPKPRGLIPNHNPHNAAHYYFFALVKAYPEIWIAFLIWVLRLKNELLAHKVNADTLNNKTLVGDAGSI